MLGHIHTLRAAGNALFGEPWTLNPTALSPTPLLSAPCTLDPTTPVTLQLRMP